MSHIFYILGAKAVLQYALQNDSPPSRYYLKLLNSVAGEIPAGNGYTAGGKEVPRGTLGFTGLATGVNYAIIKIARTTFPTSGGQIPRYGDIRYADLTTDEAAVEDRTIIARFDLGASIIVPDGKLLAITNATMKLHIVDSSDAVFTVNGVKVLFQYAFQNDSVPSTFYLALLTPDSAVGETMAGCTEIAAGNGYATGGQQIPRSTSGFRSLSPGYGFATIEIDHPGVQATGGSIPPHGAIGKAALTTDESTVANRKVLAVITFDENVSVPNGKMLTINHGTLQINAR